MPAGRPPKFNSQEKLASEIVAYFANCDQTRTMPNKAGLCIWLKISRDTYNEYKKRFPDALKAAEAMIENAWVQRLAGPNATGSIFYLKNAFSEFYRDRVETELSGNLPFSVTIVQKE
jgi:hypothetical protein